MKTNLLKKYIGYTTFKMTSFDLMYKFKRQTVTKRFEDDAEIINDEPPKNEDNTYEENDSIRVERLKKKISILLKIDNARKRIEWFQKVSSKINIGDTRFDVIDYDTSNTSMRIYANPPKTKSGLIGQQESFDFLKSDIEKEKDARLYPKQSQKSKQAKDPKKKGYWDNENQMGLFDNLEQSNEYEESNNDDYVDLDNDDYIDLDDGHTSPSIVNLKKFFAISNGSVIYRELEPQIEPIDSVYKNAIKTIQAIPLERQFVDFKYNIFDNAFNIFNHFFVLKNMRIFINKIDKKNLQKTWDSFFNNEWTNKGLEFETHTLKSLKDSLKKNTISKGKANAITKRIKLIQETFGNSQDTQRMLNTWNGVEMVKCPKGKFVSNPFGHKKMGHKPIIEEIKNDFWLSSTSLSIANVLGILSDSQDNLSKYVLQCVKKHIYGGSFVFNEKSIILNHKRISYEYENMYKNEHCNSRASLGEKIDHFMGLASKPFNIEMYDDPRNRNRSNRNVNVLEIINTNAPFILPTRKFDKMYYGFHFEKDDYLSEKKHTFCQYSIDDPNNNNFVQNTQNQNIFLMAVICNKLSEKEGLEKYYNIDYTMDYIKRIKQYEDVAAYMNKFNDDEKIHFSTIIVNGISVNPNAKGYRLPTRLEWDYASTMGGSVYYNGTNDDLELKMYSNSSINDLYSSIYYSKFATKAGYTYTKPRDIVEFLDGFKSIDDRKEYFDHQANKHNIKNTEIHLPNDWGFYYMDGVYVEMCFDFDQATNKSTKINIDTVQGYSSFLYKMQDQPDIYNKKNYINDDMLEKKYYLSKWHRESINKKVVEHWKTKQKRDDFFGVISKRLEAIEDWSVYGKTPSHTNEKSFLVMNLDFNIFDYEAILLKYESLKVNANPSREDDILLVYHVIDEVVLKLYEKVVSVLNHIKNKGKNIAIVCSRQWKNTISLVQEKSMRTNSLVQEKSMRTKDQWLGYSKNDASLLKEIIDNVFFDLNHPLDTDLGKRFLEIYNKHIEENDLKIKADEHKKVYYGFFLLIYNFYLSYDINPPRMLENLWDVIVELNEKIELIVAKESRYDDGERLVSDGLVLRLARNA